MDYAKFGDGICDKDDSGRVCCMDQFDCVKTRQVWDELTCDKMSAWTLYDTCPVCCNVCMTTKESISNIKLPLMDSPSAWAPNE